VRLPAPDRGVEPQPVVENGAPQPRTDNPGRRRASRRSCAAWWGWKASRRAASRLRARW
jgi:hypothetical protein